MKKFYILLILVVITRLMSVSQINTVTFLNTGLMNVAPGGTNGVALYIPDAMRVLGSGVKIAHNGITELGGNFYHDATTNVFDVPAATPAVPSPTTPSTGTIRFIKNHPGVNRYITTQTETLNSFNRAAYYIAMPKFEIATSDSIVLPGKMGIDAISVKRVSPATGTLILRSEPISGKDYDASLRITGIGNSDALVDLGSVVVERDVSIYRGLASSPPLFAFASPYKNTQYSGYYAGNWVRKPEVDATTGHTRYVLGNKPESTGSTVISRDQYVINPLIPLDVARAYLIQPRPTGFDYQTELINTGLGLGITGDQGNAYAKGKFYFNGKVYTLTPYLEQVFADDNLITKTLSATQSTTVNWLMGNSFTSPLSTKLIAKKMADSGLKYDGKIWVFPAGATGYQSHDITGTGDAIIVLDLDEIPAMSIFMVRVSNTNTTTGTLTIGKTEQIHGNLYHGVQNPAPMQKAAQTTSGITNQVLFRLVPEENENIYDLAAIGLREKAVLGSDSYDVPKIPSSDYAYQLYTLSSSNSKLMANGVPLNADSVVMALKPASSADNYILKTQYTETLTSEGLWLKDRQNNTITDLKLNPQYQFSSQPTDNENRFVVYFKKPANVPTGVDNASLFNITAYMDVNGKIVLKNINEKDLGSQANLFDISGKLLSSDIINNTPSFTMSSKVNPGVYIVKVTGNRSGSAKIIKKDNN